MIKGKIVYAPRVVDDESEEEVDDFDWSDPFQARDNEVEYQSSSSDDIDARCEENRLKRRINTTVKRKMKKFKNDLKEAKRYVNA